MLKELLHNKVTIFVITLVPTLTKLHTSQSCRETTQLYVCIYTYIHTHIYIYAYTCIYIRMYHYVAMCEVHNTVTMHACTCWVCIYVHTCVNINIHSSVY